MSSNSQFFTNLKAVLGNALIICLIITLMVLFDIFFNNDAASFGVSFLINIYSVLLFIIPVVFIFTKLKSSNINKWVSLIVFAICSSVLFVAWYVMNQLLEQTELSFDNILFFAVTGLLVSMVFYMLGIKHLSN